MSAPTFIWRGAPVPFRDGETIAVALGHAGVLDLGRAPDGVAMRYFGGVGACQGCLVRVNGRTVEACLAPAVAGLAVTGLDD